MTGATSPSPRTGVPSEDGTAPPHDEATPPHGEAAPSTVGLPASTGTQRQGRLEFLDALRGLAAFAVLVTHLGEALSRRVGAFATETFRPGEWGVVLFFLCSGFLIPASVERHGSMRRFWVGRAFRLLPLYWACLLAAVVLRYGFARYPLPDATWATPIRSLALNFTMVQHFLDQPLLLGNSWTLAYEMVFYLAVSALFLAGVHRESVTLAVGTLAGAAAVGVFVPELLLADPTFDNVVGVAGAAVLVATVLGRLAPPDVRARLTVAALAVVVVALVANRKEQLWLALLLFGSMFVGTVLYRFTVGELSRRTTVAVVVFAQVALVVVHLAYTFPFVAPAFDATVNWRAESLTFASAHLVFVGGVALRRFRFPRPLVYLGAISYSVYLIHPLVLYGVPAAGDNRPLTFIRWVVVTLLVSAATYHFVEKPFITLGRRVSGRVSRRRSGGPVGGRRDEPAEPVIVLTDPPVPASAARGR